MRSSIYGSYWWKCDFHNHTPKSDDYGRNPAEKANMTTRDWLLSYMRAEIDCVGVTDHNTGGWIDALKAELQIMEQELPLEVGYRPLCLFPGVEISAQGGIHILAILDPSKGTDDVSHLLGAVGMPVDGYGNGARVTAKSPAEVIEIITAAGAIAIPAHVDCAKGLFEVWGNEVSTKELLDLNQLLAVEVVSNTYSMPEVYRQAKLHLATISGSDSHSPDKVGSAYTWLKMQEPNIEALKLALHDGDDAAIRSGGPIANPNEIDNRFFIYSLKILNGMKAGNNAPLLINFSPWMTSVIGGRGSGKSSLLNFIRIPFNRGNNLPKIIKDEYDKFNKLGSRGTESGMLRSNTVIEVEFYKEGRQLKLEYTAQGDSRKLLQKNTEGEWETLSDDINPEKHYKIDIFSQKQLYELANEPNHILSLIDEKIDKSAWDEELGRLEAAWMTSRQRERELLREVKNEPDIKEELSAVDSRLKTYEGAEKDLLIEFKECNSTKASLKESVDTFDDLMAQLHAITLACSTYDLIPKGSIKDLGEVENLTAVDKKIKKEFDAITASYNNLEAIRGTITAEIRASGWYSRQTDTLEKYQKLVEELRASGQETDVDYEDLLKQKRGYQEKLSKLESSKDELAILVLAQAELRAQIYAHHKELRAKRKQILSEWDWLGDRRTISVQIDEMRDYNASEISFRALIAKPGPDFENEILRRTENENGIEEPTAGLLHDIMSWQSVEDRWTRLSQKMDAFVDSTETSQNSFGLKLIKYKEKVKLATPEALDRVLIWVPDDRVILKLLRDGREEDIDTGSAGQKTAGMLSLLLTKSTGPLIIDQPEDDLDTRLIGQLLVANFKLLKNRRQIIVVTHNPNIAVNGSSEKVVQMEFKNGQIVKLTSGALQNAKVRNAVCEIMEGGKAALDKRYYRISQALGTLS